MRLQSTYNDPAASPGLSLWRVTMAWQARQRAALRAHQLTHVQFVLLAGLVALDRPVSQAELARTMAVDAMMTSQVLRALESRALVARSRDTDDTRVINVAPTSAGQELVNAAIGDVEATDRAFFAPLGQYRDSFVRHLHALSASVSA